MASIAVIAVWVGARPTMVNLMVIVGAPSLRVVLLMVLIVASLVYLHVLPEVVVALRVILVHIEWH